MSIKTFDLVGTIHGREYTEWGEYVSAVDYRELKAENESLRADAERYRWLIDNAEEIYFCGTNLHLDTYYWGREKVHAEADKEIDAAISSPEKP